VLIFGSVLRKYIMKTEATIINGHYLFEPGVLKFDKDVEIHCCRFGSSAVRVSEEWEPNYPQHNIMFMNPQAYKVLITSTESYLSPNRELPEVILANHKQYDLVLTTDPLIINSCDNAVFFGYGTTWLNQGHIDHPDGLGKFDEEYVREFWNDKEFGLSFLCSIHSRKSTGYDLRRDLWMNKDMISIPTSFYASPRNPPPLPPGPIGADLLLPNDDRSVVFNTQFSLSIENAIVDNYFTEKLMDCFLTKTVPIYYGCPNINYFFNSRGIIDITHDADIETTINKLNNINEETYENMLPFIEENYEKALEYCKDTFAERVRMQIETSMNPAVKNNEGKLLSIGILSLEDDQRKTYLNRLLNVLNSQMSTQDKRDIEIIVNVDDGSKSVGTKRNEVLDNASGKYICFVDDDDMVSDNYIEKILNVIKAHPDVDSIGFTGMFYTNGTPLMHFKHANEYGGHYKDFKGVQHRPINHLNPVRLEIAKQIKFTEKNFGEDSDYCDALFDSKLIKKEVIIDDTLYHYLWSPEESRTHVNVNSAIPGVTDV